jgi:molybdopterin-containing oxidoreductase family iron-sulfur binding subunit
LIQDIDGGAVKMLVILGGNPVYTTPADLKLNAERMNKIPLRVHLGHYVDETGELCHWHVSEKHYLESWSDARSFDGTATIVQPLIQPLYGSKNAHEVLQLFFRENFDKTDYDIIRGFWQTQNINLAAKPVAATTTENRENQTSAPNAQTSTTPVPQAAVTPQAPSTQGAQTQSGNTSAATTGARNFEDIWRKVVHDGFVPNTEARPKTVSVNAAFLSQPQPAPAASGSLEISILPDPSVYDGRFTNNGWLQELPNPLTKVTWENVALVSPRTAARLGLNQGREAREFTGGQQGTSFLNTRGGNQFSDLVTVKMNGAEIPHGVPVWVQPGQPDDVVTIYLGYGRTKAGRVGTGLGYNAYEVRRSDAMWFGTGELSKTGAQTNVASTQIHFNMEGRDLLRVWDLEEFHQNPMNVFGPDGEHLAFIRTPGDPTNCAFGGPAEPTTLYVTSQGPEQPGKPRKYGLFRIALAAKGRP